MPTLTETIADRISGGKITEQASHIAQLAETNHEIRQDLFIVQESMSRLEQALYSPEWQAMTLNAEEEFTRQGMRDITTLARIMKIKNPLIGRGVEIQRLYVWAQGVNISAREKEINTVIQNFMDDERNRAEIGSHQARGEREEDLQQDGNLFFRFFVNSQTGRVRVRTIDPQEVDDIICNPEDKKEPWFYRRTRTVKQLSGTEDQVTEYYPDWRFIPISKVGFTEDVAKFGGVSGRIIWDTPVMHVAVNKVGRWGISEFYAANDWATAYKNFLEQLASVWQALARWSHKLSTKGGKTGVAAAKAKLGTTRTSTGGNETNPPPVTGSTFIQAEGIDLQPFRTAGATMSADDGRRLMLMAQMRFGFPETFYSDASVGSLATAKSLDRPTELKIIDRQTLHRDILKDIFSFVLLWAVKAPQGPLTGFGTVEKEKDGKQYIERIKWNDDIDGNVDIAFPSVIEHDTLNQIQAIVEAQTLGGRPAGDGVPLETAVQQLLVELGLQNVDEIMEEWKKMQAKKAAQAEMMPEPPQPDEMPPEEEPEDMPDEMTMESVWMRRIDAFERLADELEGNAINGNRNR